jgi:hypothetical protein
MKRFIIILFSAVFIPISAQTFCVSVALTQNLQPQPNHYAYFDETGKTLYTENIDPLVNERIFPYKDGLGRIRRKGKFGFANHKGEVMIPFVYDAAEDFENGLAKVKNNGKWGYINTKGEVVVPLQYEILGDFCEGMASFGTNGKYGFLNKEGKVSIMPVFNLVTNFNYNRAWVFMSGKWGCINKYGAFTSTLDYDDAYEYIEGYSWVKSGLRWGLIDTLNKFIITQSERNYLVYTLKEESSTFASVSNGLLISKANDKVGYSSIPSLKKIIPSKFDDGFEFQDSLAIVRADGKFGIIDTKGNYVVEPLYKEISRVGQKTIFAVRTKESELGLLNITTQKFSPFKCKDILYVEKIETP